VFRRGGLAIVVPTPAHNRPGRILDHTRVVPSNRIGQDGTEVLGWSGIPPLVLPPTHHRRVERFDRTRKPAHGRTHHHQNEPYGTRGSKKKGWQRCCTTRMPRSMRRTRAVQHPHLTPNTNRMCGNRRAKQRELRTSRSKPRRSQAPTPPVAQPDHTGSNPSTRPSGRTP
jgi:hypothetical protein